MEKVNSILFDGDIYLKRGPEKTSASFLSNIEDLINRLECLNEENINEKEKSNFLKLKDSIINTRNEATDGKLFDYSYVDSFHILRTDGKQIQIINHKKYEFENQNIRIFDNVEELNEYYISLSDFLKQANYVGRFFARTAPVEIEKGEIYDKLYMDGVSNPYILVLYATQELLLVKEFNKETKKEKFKLISSRYTYDKNYVLFGEVNKDYLNPAKVYTEIKNQITK